LIIENEGITNPTRLILENYGEITIRPEDHKATGGEGSIFRCNNVVVKIYLDPQKMEKDDMPEKIRQLSFFKHPFVVAPRGLAFNLSKEPIGYYMQFVEGIALPLVFTNTFWREQGFTFEKALLLVEKMRDVVFFAHKRGAILRDPNELNWLVVWDKNGNPEPRIIDVDSWSIGKWQGNVVMNSVRDWHTKGCRKESDWFAWGTVTFQILTGIHPYKGTLPGFKRGDLEKRMKANASVFSKGIRLVRAVRDFSNIPGPLLDWYVDTFQQGKRIAPPSPLEKGKKTTVTKQVIRKEEGEALVFEKIFNLSGDSVVYVFPCGVVLFKSKKLVDLKTKTVIGKAQTRSCNVISVDGGWILAEKVNQKLSFSFISESNFSVTQLQFEIESNTVISANNRLFVVTERGLTEVKIYMIGKPILSLGEAWGVMPNETTWFDGVGIQDAMGAMYLVVPFGEEACAHIRMRELDGMKPVLAKAGHRFATIVAVNKSGLYQKMELSFDENYRTYELWQGGTDVLDLNVAILPTRVCATIVSDGELHLFSPSGKKKVVDKRITTDSSLFAWEDTVLLAKGGTVWEIHTRK
jgi:hypothetical protein